MYKKTIIILALIFISIGNCSAQFIASSSGLGLNIGGARTFELEIIGEMYKYTYKRFNNAFVLGFGMGAPIKTNAKGEWYSTVHPEDLVASGIKKQLGAYLSPGYTIGRFSLMSRLGVYSLEYYETGYDYDYYHTTEDIGWFPLYGAAMHFKLTRVVAINIGYNNFSHFNVGLNFRVAPHYVPKYAP